MFWDRSPAEADDFAGADAATLGFEGMDSATWTCDGAHATLEF